MELDIDLLQKRIHDGLTRAGPDLQGRDDAVRRPFDYRDGAVEAIDDVDPVGHVVDRGGPGTPADGNDVEQASGLTFEHGDGVIHVV